MDLTKVGNRCTKPLVLLTLFVDKPFLNPHTILREWKATHVWNHQVGNTFSRFNSEGPNSLKTARSSSFYRVHLVNERTSAWLIHIPFFLITSLSWLVKSSSFVAWLWLRDPLVNPPWSMLIRFLGSTSNFCKSKTGFFLGEHLPGPIHPHPPVDLPCLGRGAFLRQAAQKRQRRAPGGAAELLGEVAWKPTRNGKIHGKNWWYSTNDGKIHGKIYGLMWFMIHDGFIPLREKMFWAMGIFREKQWDDSHDWPFWTREMGEFCHPNRTYPDFCWVKTILKPACLMVNRSISDQEKARKMWGTTLQPWHRPGGGPCQFWSNAQHMARSTAALSTCGWGWWVWSTHRKVIGDHHIPLVGIKIANADGYIFVLAGRATHSSKKYGDSYLSKVEDGKSCRMFKATSACSDVTFCERLMDTVNTSISKMGFTLPINNTHMLIGSYISTSVSKTIDPRNIGTYTCADHQLSPRYISHLAVQLG